MTKRNCVHWQEREQEEETDEVAGDVVRLGTLRQFACWDAGEDLGEAQDKATDRKQEEELHKEGELEQGEGLVPDQTTGEAEGVSRGQRGIFKRGLWVGQGTWRPR